MNDMLSWLTATLVMYSGILWLGTTAIGWIAGFLFSFWSNDNG